MNYQANIEEDLPELVRLELKRRTDIAYAVAREASRLFGIRADLDDRLRDEKKTANSPWYWIVFFIGLGLHHFFAGEGQNFSWASWISFASLAVWIAKKYDIQTHERSRNECNEKLYALSVAWEGATARSSFWDIGRFFKEAGFDPQDDSFLDWWGTVRRMILYDLVGTNHPIELK